MEIVKQDERVLVLRYKPYKYWVLAAGALLVPVAMPLYLWAASQTFDPSQIWIASPFALLCPFSLALGRTFTTRIDRVKGAIYSEVKALWGTKRVKYSLKRLKAIDVAHRHSGRSSGYRVELQLQGAEPLLLGQELHTLPQKPTELAERLKTFLGQSLPEVVEHSPPPPSGGRAVAQVAGGLALLAVFAALKLLPHGFHHARYEHSPMPQPHHRHHAAAPREKLTLDSPSVTRLQSQAASSPQAQELLAECYEKGDGVPQNLPLALSWYKKAAAAGNALAQCNLGAMYFQGRGVPADDVEARRLFQLSSQGGSPDAAGNLAFMAYLGRGGPKDMHLALDGFLKATEAGDPKVYRWTARVIQEGAEGHADPVAVYQWYALAAKSGDAQAIAALPAAEAALSPSQLAEAQGRIAAWQKRHPAQGGG